MKTFPLLSSFLILLATLPALPGAIAFEVEDVTWGAAGTPVEAAPGDTGKPLTALIRNNGYTTYSGVRASIGPAYYGDITGHIYPTSGSASASLGGSFAPGDVWTARFTVNVLPEAYTGFLYQMPITLDLYDRTNNTFVTEQLVIQVAITGRAVLDVTLDTTTLVAGQEETIVAKVTNIGTGPAGEVRITPNGGQALAILDGDTTQQLGGLRPGQSGEITLHAKPTQAGTASLAFALAYADAAGTASQVTRTKVLQVEEAPVPEDDWGLTVRILEQDVDAGGTANVTFLLQNSGTATLRGAQAKVAVSGELVVPDATDEQRVGDLPPGGEARMVVHVVTDNSARGIQRVPLTLTWKRDDGTTGARTFSLAIPVVGTVEPSVSAAAATVNNQTMAATISGTLTNLGNTQALNAYVQLLGNGNYAATQVQFVGDLSPNTGVPFTITTTLLNASIGGAQTGGVGAAMGGGAGGAGGAGRFPGGGGNAPGGAIPGNGTAPQGGFQGGGNPRGNGTFPGGGAGGPRAGANAVQILVTWTDDYGNPASQVLTVQATPRAASTATTRGVTTASDGSGTILGVSYLGAGLIVGAIAAAAVGVAVVKRRRS